MAYITISELPELLNNSVTGNEYILITDEANTSNKIKLNELNTYLDGVMEKAAQDLKNKVLDDVSNFIHSNATQYYAIAMTDLSKGDPVKVSNTYSGELPGVDLRESVTDACIGLVERDCLEGEICEVIVSGTLDVPVYYPVGTRLYPIPGLGLSDSVPNSGIIQSLAFVLKDGEDGKLLINGELPQESSNIRFESDEFESNTVEEALIELKNNLSNATVSLQTELITIDKTLIVDNKIDLSRRGIGAVLNNSAMIFESEDSNVYIEVSCSMSSDSLSVVFDPEDDLNGKYAIVSYLAGN